MNLLNNIKEGLRSLYCFRFFEVRFLNNPHIDIRQFSLSIILIGTIFYLLGKFFTWSPVVFGGWLVWLTGAVLLSNLILKRYFFGIWNYFLGVLLVFYLFGFVLSFFNSFIFLNFLTSAVALLVVGLILYVFSAYKFEIKKTIDNNLVATTIATEPSNNNFVIADKFLLILEFLLSGLLLFGFWELLASVTESAVYNPWNFLSGVYALAGVVAFLIIGLLVFMTRQKPNRLLFWLVVFSFLVHGYLLVSSAGFNADRFRHLGSEYRLMNYFNEIDPTIKSADWSKNIDFFGFSIPNPLININQFSYSFQWSEVVFFSDLLQVDLFFVDLFLGWIFWSLFIIILFYVLGLIITNYKTREALFFPLASLVFFQLIYYGGQTLPVAWGALFFLFFIILIVARLRNLDFNRDYFLLFLFLVSLFSYTLSFLLVGLACFLIFSKNKFFPIIISMLSIFLLELFSSYSYLSSKFLVSWREVFNTNLFFFIGDNFLFWRVDWLSGVGKLFFMFCCLLILFLVIKYLKSRSRNKEIDFVLLFLLILVVNFFLSILFLQGTLISVRRLNVFVSLLLVIFVGYVCYWLILNQKKFVQLIFIFFLTLLFSLAWFSGPNTSIAVSLNDWRSAKIITERISYNYSDYCVLSDINVLLPLEALTEREIAGGNFSIDSNHGQPELNFLLKELYQQKSKNIGKQMIEASQKSQCWLVVAKNKLDPILINDLNTLYGSSELLYENYFWLIK